MRIFCPAYQQPQFRIPHSAFRILLPGLLALLGIFPLTAQEENAPYYIQQAPAKEMDLGCYQRSIEEGRLAQKRGDCRLALRWFNEAQYCPEIAKDPARLAELRALIAQCSEPKAETARASAALPAKPAATTALPRSSSGSSPAPRRRFQPSREFLLFDKPECYDITCREAARAYAGGYWDDAAALYRAAKNCTDADQADRLAANDRITACRLAAQNELLEKEQEAVRQARHALASKLANDARQLLRNYDRSLAFRLADFANEYIAPDDNDACLQTMFDALYYNPAIHAGPGNEQLQIPFCYQLGDNLDRDLQVCFLGREKSRNICAFAPGRHLLFQWDARTFEPLKPINLEDTSLLYIDAVPDGRTLLFASRDAYVFWRSPREIFRLPVRQTSRYCFGDHGRIFYFIDLAEAQVYALDLGEAFATRKGSSQRAIPAATGIQVFSGILNLATGNGQLWLGYADSLVTYVPERARSRLWAPGPTYPLAYRTPGYFHGQPPFLWLDPDARTAVFANDTSAVYFEIPENHTEALLPLHILSGGGLAVGARTALVASYQLDALGGNSRLFIYQPAEGALRYKALIPTRNIELDLRSGAFSPDNRYFATTTSSGKLKIWLLAEDSNQDQVEFADSRFVAPNANGSHLFIWQNDSILLAPIGQPDQTTLALPAPPDADIPGLLAAQHWLAFRDGDETIVLFNTETRQQHRLASPRGGLEEVLGAFRPDEREFVCISEADSATVYQLPSGTVAGGRRFGGAVAQLSFVPQTNEVLVVHYTEGESGDQEQTVIKLWNPAEIDPDIPLRSVRLQGYETREVAFSKRQDGFIAFTNGLDVRIFRQNDLLDETVRIRQNGSHMVTALEFHPDGGILAAGYEDGSVIFWNVSTGQARFTWPAPAGMDALAPSPVVRIRFVEQGRRLLLLFQNNLLLLRDLELSRIRAGVQTDFRKLISFQPSEIREYDLEQAFDHRNNFSRLAASGDLPLVRSFFDYFRETALFSNNVQRVGYACDRAASLFSQLDADTREVLQAILLEMLEDYHWKLLLRNQTAAAARVASVMQRDFDNPVAAELAYAHTALLDDDAPTATRRYAAWAFRKAETSGGLLPPRALDSLYAKMVQLLEYSLIQPEELDAVCSLFGGFPPFDQRCQPFDAMSAARLLPAEMALRWRIFQQLNQSQFTNHHHKRVGLLEAALADTRQLRRLNTAAYADNLENVVLALGQAYTQWAIFEQNQAYALAYYQKALDYLSANGPFASPASEQRRQNDLIANCLYLGNTYQNRGQLPEAGASYQQGLQTANQLLQQVQGLPALFQKFQNENNGPLNTQLGYNFLLQGNAGAAFQAFEQAQNDRVEGIHRLFFGHAALLDNDPANASLEYANILTEASLGQALFDIERMAGRLPTHRARLLDFAHTLRQARLSTRQQLDSTATDYYRAYLKINLFGAQQQWDSAQYWSAVATELAERVFYRHPDDISWQNNWLDALLNQTYYLLYSTNRDTAQLGRAIRLSLEAQQYFEENDRYGYYPNQALIHTNLAHAYWLRQQPGDRERALAAYLAFLNSHYDAYDPWELLLKDFRDLRRAGVPWPDLPELLEAIRPEGAEISPADQEALGR